ncbi:hypothetical protein BESB_036690 [Besnoitia besnoiti]|uniref:Transmembrane protein n=1 Tax=Besnoitia besnoiti TaxID=94643 RepID=A0A2A9MLJ8_BESBE|nr:hypothetical protein BESB_036690 [Besnoitia besnoiti]PFH37211.1 hypothetical protein BESB_036690 [Besnoitia besnoiti]
MSPFPPRAALRLFPVPSGSATLPFAQGGVKSVVASLGLRSAFSAVPLNAGKRFFASPSKQVPSSCAVNGGTHALSLSRPRLGGSLEDYYTNSQLATCIQSPWPFYMWSFWAFLMVVVPVGLLFQSNYYFSGRILPKVNGNTQLCEDSW